MLMAVGLSNMDVQGQQLVCSAFGCGNLLARINDGCADPMSPSPSPSQHLDRPANVRLLPVAVGNWPFLFVVTLEALKAGDATASLHYLSTRQLCKHSIL